MTGGTRSRVLPLLRGGTDGLRRLRSTTGSAAVVVLLALAIGAVAGAVPRELTATADATLTQLLADAPASRRGVQTELLTSGRDASRPDLVSAATITAAESGGHAIREDLPGPVGDIITGTDHTVTMPTLNLPGADAQPPGKLTLRYLEDLPAHARVVDGRLPADDPPPPEDVAAAPDSEPMSVPVVEFAVGRKAASTLEMEPGDELLVSSDLTVLLARPAMLAPTRGRILLRLTGVLALDPVDDPYWFGDSGLHEAGRVSTLSELLVIAQGVVSPAGYATMVERGYGAQHVWRHRVSPNAVDGTTAPALDRAVTRLTASHPLHPGIGDTRYGVQTGLPDLLDTAASQFRVARRLAAVVVLAAFGVALTLLVLVGGLSATERRQRLALLRSRGASATQLATGAIVEAATLVVPAVAIGTALALGTLTGRGTSVALAAAVAAAVAVITALTAGTLADLRLPLRAALTEHTRSSATHPAARALQVAVVVAAVGGAILLRRRGLASDDGDDLLLVAVPVLLAAAAAIVVTRLLPPVVGVLARRAARHTGSVVPLALRRVAREPSATFLPLLLILTSLAVAGFGVVVARTIDAGRIDAAWDQTGADVTIESTGSDLDGLDLSGIDGITARADLRVMTTDVSVRGQVERMQLVAADPADLERVTSGTPAAVTVPPQDEAGADTVTAVVTRAPGSPAVAVGEQLQATIRGRPLTFVVGAVERDLVGFDDTPPILLLDDAALADRDIALPTTRVLLRGPVAASDVGRTVGDAEVLGRREQLASLRSSPLATSASRMLWGAVAVTSLLAVGGTTAALVLTARRRRRDLAYLGAMGMAGRQLRWLALAETAPVGLLGVGVGLAVGVGVAALTIPVTGLRAFAGGRAPTMALALGPLTVLALGTAAALLLAAALVTARLRRTDPTRILRQET